MIREKAIGLGFEDIKHLNLTNTWPGLQKKKNFYNDYIRCLIGDLSN